MTEQATVQQKPSKDQVKAFIAAIFAVGDTIKELGQVPSGELYVQVMEHMSLATYTRIIELLKASGKVIESNHLLTWVS